MDPLGRRTFLKKAAIGATGGGVLSACGGAGSNEVQNSGSAGASGPEVSWRVTSSFPRALDILYGAAEVMAERVAALTGGRFRIRVYPAGELVPGLQVMDAVQQGTVQAGHTSSYYYIGKHPALAFDAGVPFGLTTRQQNAWLYHGGGIELIREVLSNFGIVQFPCGNSGGQMGGWFRSPVESVADIRGLRMRIPGLGGEVMSRLGATVQVLAGGDIFPALERGAVDATEWVGPHDDEKLGFHDIAKNYYYPGWHEPGVSLSLHVNRSAWDQLPEAYQEAVASACKEVTIDTVAQYDVANPKALARLVNDHDVQLRRFSNEILRAAWLESNNLLEELAAENAGFRRVFDNWNAFRRTAFPYFARNELEYEAFAFRQLSA